MTFRGDNLHLKFHQAEGVGICRPRSRKYQQHVNGESVEMKDGTKIQFGKEGSVEFQLVLKDLNKFAESRHRWMRSIAELGGTTQQQKLSTDHPTADRNDMDETNCDPCISCIATAPKIAEHEQGSVLGG